MIGVAVSVRHAGQILREDFMERLQLSVADVAASSGMSQQRVYELIRGRRGVSVDTAVRLGIVFRMRARHWLSMQAEWDLAGAEKPEDARAIALPRGVVTGPKGVIRLPDQRPPPVDDRVSDELAEAVRQAAEILRPFQRGGVSR